MPPKKLSDDDFIKVWRKTGSPHLVSQSTGLSIRAVYQRRLRLMERGVPLATISKDVHQTETTYSPLSKFERRRTFEIKNGTVVVFSDPHWLPDHSPIAHDALETVVKQLKPQLVVCGGDALDGDMISRWDPTRGHRQRFSVREELDCMVEHFDSLRKVSGKAQFAWTLGNHDARLSRYIAVHADKILDLPYTRLEDWVPHWPLSWTVEINQGRHGFTVIRHRNQAGMLHLQAVKAGCHYVHGHLHKLNVHTQATFSGYRYSVDTGSLADPESEGFDYMEGGANHAQGFAVLTFKDWKLMPPELCVVVDGQAWFRGSPV